MYKSLNVVDMLTIDDLPGSIAMCNIEFPVDFLELKTEIAHVRNDEPFLRRSVPNTGDEFMFLLFMGGFTTELMKHHNHFYLFDSHSRDSRGLSVVDGTSVLMKVSDLFEVENYIQAYLECDSMEQSYFQLQFIHFSICRELQLDILSCAKRVRRRLTYQEKSTNLQSKRKETPAKVSMKNDLSKIELEFAASSTSQERMLREDNFASSENLKQVTLFKKLIREGPYFICVICSRCLYKRSIVRFDFTSYSSLVKELEHLVSSYDGRLYICRTCHNKVKKMMSLFKLFLIS